MKLLQKGSWVAESLVPAVFTNNLPSVSPFLCLESSLPIPMSDLASDFGIKSEKNDLWSQNWKGNFIVT